MYHCRTLVKRYFQGCKPWIVQQKSGWRSGPKAILRWKFSYTHVKADAQIVVLWRFYLFAGYYMLLCRNLDEEDCRVDAGHECHVPPKSIAVSIAASFQIYRFEMLEWADPAHLMLGW